MNSILVGAQYGDKFLTRDGHIAIYGRSFISDSENVRKHYLMVNDYHPENENEENDYILPYDDGHIFHDMTDEACKAYGWNKEEMDNHRLDIVSKIQY